MQHAIADICAHSVQAAELRSQWRASNGSVEIRTPESSISVSVDAGGDAVVSIAATDQWASPSRQLVSEMMVLAGEAVAAFGAALRPPCSVFAFHLAVITGRACYPYSGASVTLRHLLNSLALKASMECMSAKCAVSLAGADAGLALPYRSQAAPVLRTAERMAALPEGLCRSVALRGCMTRSVVSVADPQPHAALGLPAYVQFTSPIRRYSDLLAHFQVRSRAAQAGRHSLSNTSAAIMNTAVVIV